MQGKKQYLDKEVARFRLSERVPPHNLYRRLAEWVDWSFLYEETRALYSHTGQPSLDPVVFFKLVLVGRLENLVSDRRLVEHCALRLDILFFLGYEVDEELPWHSTVSRTRQFFPAAVFERLFDHVFAQCVARGLVAGDTQAVDSAPVKANASLEAVLEKQVAGTRGPFLATDEPAASVPAASVVTAPAHQLRNLAAHHARLAAHSSAPGAQHPQARLLSNKTHYSPTDPDARISIKPGKARALNYLCSLAVDTAKGVISHVQADFADSRDSLHLPRLLTGLQRRLRAQELRVRDLLADAGYANGSNYALLEAQHITAWIPVFGQYKAEIAGFTYDASTDAYTCAAGKVLPFRKYDTTADGNGLKIYWATCSDCQQCPSKPTCVPGAKRKQLTRTLYDAPYRRAWQRQQSRRGQRMRRVRQSTVEPVFGNLIHHYGLRRVNVRGQAGAHKTMLLTAVAYNLKKLLKYRPQQQLSLAVALPRPLLAAKTRACRRNRRTEAPTRPIAKGLLRNRTTHSEFCNSHGRFSATSTQNARNNACRQLRSGSGEGVSQCCLANAFVCIFHSSQITHSVLRGYLTFVYSNMASPHRLLAVFAAVSLSLPGAAQTRVPAEYKRTLLVGLGASVGTYQLPAGLSANVVSPVPMVSIQLRPRLAIQASAAYYQESFRVHNGGFIGSNGQLNYQPVAGTDRRRTVPVSVLARYILTRQLGKRLQADALAGITLVGSSLHKQGAVLDSAGRAISAYNYGTASTGTYFSGGAGLRYRVKPHLDWMADWVFNKLINAQSAVPIRLSATLTVGLRYRFAR